MTYNILYYNNKYIQNIMARISYNDKSSIIDNVIQLKKDFTRLSFKHIQIYHDNGWYIYKLSPTNFEVFKEKIVKTIEYIDGKISVGTLLKVKYPDDEDFGDWAWSVNSYERAMEYINHYKA